MFFPANWLHLIVTDKFATIEAMLIRNLSFLVPPSVLKDHVYKVSEILRKGVCQISPG